MLNAAVTNLKGIDEQKNCVSYISSLKLHEMGIFVTTICPFGPFPLILLLGFDKSRKLLKLSMYLSHVLFDHVALLNCFFFCLINAHYLYVLTVRSSSDDLT